MKTKFYLLCSTVLALGTLLGGCEKECPCEDVFVTAFTDPNYTGESQTFVLGEYQVADLVIVGNDKISSIRLSPEHCVKVTLCEHAGALGSCREYTSNQINLGDLDNKVSFLKVEKK